MKESSKIRSHAESHSATEAARLLGVSTPTLKRMEAEGQVEGFRTPGGHLRIVATSIEAIREHRRQPRPARDASPVLLNRRERVEEVNLQVQELRARRELDGLRREEAEEAERREAEAEENEQEAAERRETLALERERLAREEARERQGREVQQQLAAFRCSWLEQANELVGASELRWLSLAQRKEVMDALEAEIMKPQPHDTPRMAMVLARAAAACIEPMIMERDANRERERRIESALWSLPAFATDAEKAEAAASAREALSRLPYSAQELELRSAAEKALEPVRRKVARRLMTERVLNWLVLQLPWQSTEQEKSRLRRECVEILGKLPEDVSEIEAKDALEPAIRTACQEIAEREARKVRDEKKAALVRQGLAEISNYLWQLKERGEITTEEFLDSDFKSDLERTITKELQRELSGEETAKEVKEVVHDFIHGELG